MRTKSSNKRALQNKRLSNLLKWGLPVALILAALGIWLGLRSPLQPSSSTVQSGVNVGNVAPDFTVPTLGGGAFVLSENRGKPTIILFMAYWCGNCIPEARALAQLKNEYGEQVNIIAIDVDSSSTKESLEQFKQAADNGAYVWAFDNGMQVLNAYQVGSLDTTLILDKNGVVVYRDERPTAYETLKSELEKLQP
jgi:thiol-disulfide isomerase/thioredoxin